MLALIWVPALPAAVETPQCDTTDNPKIPFPTNKTFFLPFTECLYFSYGTEYVVKSRHCALIRTRIVIIRFIICFLVHPPSYEENNRDSYRNCKSCLTAEQKAILDEDGNNNNYPPG